MTGCVSVLMWKGEEPSRLLSQMGNTVPTDWTFTCSLVCGIALWTGFECSLFVYLPGICWLEIIQRNLRAFKRFALPDTTVFIRNYICLVHIFPALSASTWTLQSYQDCYWLLSKAKRLIAFIIFPKRATIPAENILCGFLILIISGEDSNLRRSLFSNLCIMFKFWCIICVPKGGGRRKLWPHWAAKTKGGQLWCPRNI